MKLNLVSPLSLFILTTYLSSCGGDDALEFVTPSVRNEFVSFLDRLGTVSDTKAFGKGYGVGTTLWDFDDDGVFIFATVGTRVGNQSMWTIFGGNYTISSSANSMGEYTAKCYVGRKHATWMPSGETPVLNIVEMLHDETVTVQLKRDGETLLVNGVRYYKT